MGFLSPVVEQLTGLQNVKHFNDSSWDLNFLFSHQIQGFKPRALAVREERKQPEEDALPIIVGRGQHDWGTWVGITGHPGAVYGKHHQHHHCTHYHHPLQIGSDHSTIFFLLHFFLFLVTLRLLLARLEKRGNLTNREVSEDAIISGIRCCNLES